MVKKVILVSLACIIISGASCIKKQEPLVPVQPVPTHSAEQSLVAMVPAIEDYLSTKLSTPSRNPSTDTKMFSAFIPYGQEEKNGKLHYYVWAFREEYRYKNKKLEKVSGRASPVALVIEKKDDVYVRVVSHKLPEDGSAYTSSMKKIFPADVIKKMSLKTTESNQRSALLQKEIKNKAALYFNFKLSDSLDTVEAEKCTAHSFERYKMDAKDVYTGTTLADWDTVYNSSTYPNYELRKKIAAGYFGGEVNFAGHFVVVSWSCGKKCQEHAVVDMLTGRIVKTGLTSQYGIEFKLNSLALVTNPYRDILEPEPHSFATRYYVLNDKGAMPQLNVACSYNDKKTSGSSESISNTPVAEKKYLSRKKDECAVMLIQCKAGEQVFVDDIGCGCEPGGP